MTSIDSKNDTPATDTERAAWVKPAIVRMDPGSAESGGRAAPDGGAANS